MPYEYVMSPAARMAFLEGVHVGILAVEEGGRGPLAAPIWYRVVDDTVEFGISASSTKAQLLRAAGRATLLVQDETPPYRYVSVEGPIAFVDRPYDMLAAATRYLGPEIGALYAAGNQDGADTVVVVLQPEHWRTQDFSTMAEEFGGAAAGG